VGPSGSVVGVDFSQAMLARAAARAAPAANASFCRAAAEQLPLAAASVDVALVNGLFNLNPARAAIFEELARVVRPGGRVFAAELVLREPGLTGEFTSPDDWFA
jgi:ubiquinone/menaquinone biosynthesis C-methylase UbiE